MVEQIKERTKNLALEIIYLCRSVPQKQEYFIISKQLMRSATSVAANYRSACRGRSKIEFIAKLGIVEEEADESMFWLELLKELGGVDEEKIDLLFKEMSEILAIIVTTRKTSKQNLNR